MSIRILIADDHPIVRNGLLALLATQPDFEVVGEASNGKEVLELANSASPEIILMDLQMPEMDGLSATKEILAINPAVKIIILTTYETNADILPTIEAGAIGYLLKDTVPESLFNAIRGAARGEMTLAPSVAQKLSRRLSGVSKQDLSLREIEVLELAATGDTNKEIADKLHITETTVKSHFVHIFNKLGVSDRTAAVTLAVKEKIIRI